jgi:TfoX/Sxy family transcriptional regulator of competence genes
LPEACYDDPDVMRLWANRAFEASKRAELKKKPKAKNNSKAS